MRSRTWDEATGVGVKTPDSTRKARKAWPLGPTAAAVHQSLLRDAHHGIEQQYETRRHDPSDHRVDIESVSIRRMRKLTARGAEILTHHGAVETCWGAEKIEKRANGTIVTIEHGRKPAVRMPRRISMGGRAATCFPVQASDLRHGTGSQSCGRWRSSADAETVRASPRAGLACMSQQLGRRRASAVACPMVPPSATSATARSRRRCITWSSSTRPHSSRIPKPVPDRRCRGLSRTSSTPSSSAAS